MRVCKGVSTLYSAVFMIAIMILQYSVYPEKEKTFSSSTKKDELLQVNQDTCNCIGIFLEGSYEYYIIEFIKVNFFF